MSLARQIKPKMSKLEQQKALLGGQVSVKKKAAPPTRQLQKPRDLDVELSMISLDQAAQPREHLSTDKTSEYAEAMEAGVEFPPLVVFHDGASYWLADGFHRHYAAQQIKRRTIRCMVHTGGLRDAILYSVGANSDHGLPRSDEDKRRAVSRLLHDEEWSRWSDREIARRCRVSDKTVAKYRASPDTAEIRSMDRTFIHPKTGQPTVMRTDGINAGRHAAPPPVASSAPEPAKPAENLRAAIGTDTATAAERGNNLYETPPEAVHALLALENFGHTIWEPACGRGAISRLLEALGHEVLISDLVDYGTANAGGELQAVEDFLATPADPTRADIITNPPYGGVLNAFVAHAIRVQKPQKMALLLNLNFLAGFDDPDRNFVMDECPPARIHVFTRRLPMMHRDGWDGPEASSRMNTAWFVWEQNKHGDYRGPTVLNRVDWKGLQPVEAAA